MFNLCARTIIKNPKYITYLLMCLLSLVVGLAIPFLTGQLVNNFVGVARDGESAIAIGAEIAALGIMRIASVSWSMSICKHMWDLH